MPVLIAVGPEPGQRMMSTIGPSEVVLLGRAPRHGLTIEWDTQISREHVEVEWTGSKLRVRCLPTARNPILYDGKPLREEFQVACGSGFRIGRTDFRLDHEDVEQTVEATYNEVDFTAEELRHAEFDRSGLQMDLLCRLPHILTDSVTDEDLAARLANLLLQAIPESEAVAVARYADGRDAALGKPAVMRWDSRGDSDLHFRPSKRLLSACLSSERSRLHVHGGQTELQPSYTLSEDLDWAFCTPMAVSGGKGWCLYVAGTLNKDPGLMTRPGGLKGHIRFAELIAQFIGSARRMRELERQKAGMAQFFSPAVVETLNGADAKELLLPRETEITVLFCDVRGFSRKSEQAQDKLQDLLDRVSQALSVMTVGIVRHDGVIADFQGDAALGFWGWPVANEEGPLPACRAALQIQAEFAKAHREGGALAGFRVGIGVAHGKAIAGKIGSCEQSKVGVFGPVVNLGARLEGLTKATRTSILIDEATARRVREEMPPDEGRCRRLGRFCPAGMDTAVEVSELLPPATVDGTLSPDQVRDFESAVDILAHGDFSGALEMLGTLPVTDRPKDFLSIFIAQHNYEPPSNWDGIIRMTAK